MKTVIIYKSNTGFTKMYAEWLQKDLGADIFEVSKVNINILKNYDVVIYGGSLHAVGIIGVNFIKHNLDKLKDKKVIVFATGATPPREEDINLVRDKNFTEEQLKFIKFFYLRGGFDYSKLKAFDKVLMTFLKWNLKRKKNLTADERGMLASYKIPVDFTRRKNIEQIITCVNS